MSRSSARWIALALATLLFFPLPENARAQAPAAPEDPPAEEGTDPTSAPPPEAAEEGDSGASDESAHGEEPEEPEAEEDASSGEGGEEESADDTASPDEGEAASAEEAATPADEGETEGATTPADEEPTLPSSTPSPPGAEEQPASEGAESADAPVETAEGVEPDRRPGPESEPSPDAEPTPEPGLEDDLDPDLAPEPAPESSASPPPPPPSAPASAEAPASAQVQSAEPAEDVDPPRGPDVRAGAALELVAGFQLLSRHLTYEDDVFGFLREYELGGGPVFRLEGRWFPGAHFAEGLASVFGIDFRFDRSAGIESERSNILLFPTVHRIVQIALLGRWQIGDHAVIGSFGYGDHVFELERSAPAAPDLTTVPDIPSMQYRFLRYGAETRLSFVDHFGAQIAFAFLQTLDTGGIEEDVWFPRAEANGIELRTRLLIGLPRGFEVRVGTEWRRYFFDFDPDLDSPFIAGGALDQYVGVDLDFAWRLL